MNSNEGIASSSNDSIPYQEGIYDDKDWENIDIPVNEVCIPDKDTAIKVASAIVDRFQKEGYFPDYIPQTVFFDTEDKIWIISFGENRGLYDDGSDFSIALKAENAEVIKMWVGE